MRGKDEPGFWRRQDAAVEVEYVLIMAFVIVPLSLALPGFIIWTNREFFERLDFWTHLPFP